MMVHYCTGKCFVSNSKNVKYVAAIILLSLIGTSLQEDECSGGPYVNNYGIITSPNYPDYYPSNQHCIYSIVRDTPGPMSLRFIVFSMEQHNSCMYDYIQIYDGESTDEYLLLETLCGISLPDTIHTTSNKATILFHSDGSISQSGFQIVYGDPLDCVTEHPDGKCVPAGSCLSFGHIEAGALCEDHNNVCCIDDPTTQCGGLFEGESGMIYSPNYPSEYTNNQDCVYVIKRPSGRVALTFLDFHLEAHGTCVYDFVKIYDGPRTSDTLLATYCGETAREALSSGSTMTVQFHTDSSSVETGFKASWGEPDCPFWGGYCTQGACAIGYSNYSCSSGQCCLDQCDLRNDKICPDGTCIPLSMTCDPYAHSQPGGIRCPAAGQMCSDGTCISIAYQCPCHVQEIRCWDGSCASDSALCPCTSSEVYQCMDDYGCYNGDMRCNGVTDCMDSSDEYNCEDGDYYGSPTSTAWIYILIGMFAVVIFVCILIGTLKRRHTQFRARRAASANRMAQGIAVLSSTHTGEHAYDNLGMMPPPAYGEAVTGPYPVAPPNYYNSQTMPNVLYNRSTTTTEECPPPYDSVSHITDGIVFLYGSAVPKPDPPAYAGEPPKDLPPYPGPPLAMAYNPLYMVPPAPLVGNVHHDTDAVVPEALESVTASSDSQSPSGGIHRPALDDVVESSDAGTTLPAQDQNPAPGEFVVPAQDQNPAPGEFAVPAQDQNPAPGEFAVPAQDQNPGAGEFVVPEDQNPAAGEFADVSLQGGATNYAFKDDVPSSTPTAQQPSVPLNNDYNWNEEHYI